MCLKQRLASAVLVTALSLVPALANAAQQTGGVHTPPDEAASADGDYLLLGVGALVYRSPFLGEGTSVFPIPIISARRGAFYADGLEAGVSWSPGSGQRYASSLDLFVAARAIAGESREKVTGDIGVRASLDTPGGTFAVDYRRDMTGEFDGAEAGARYEYTLAIGRFSITPGIQANWLDRETASHMYGVSAEQRQDMIDDRADTILPVFRLRDGGVNIGGDVTVLMPVTDNIVAIAYLSGTYLGRSIRENPGLRDEFEAQAMIGVGYRF